MHDPVNDVPENLNDSLNDSFDDPANNIQYNTHCDECGAMCCFTDDSLYSRSNKDPEQLSIDIAAKYSDISDYMSKNKLILNSDKTHRNTECTEILELLSTQEMK